MYLSDYQMYMHFFCKFLYIPKCDEEPVCSETGGQFKLKSGGQFHRFFHLNLFFSRFEGKRFTKIIGPFFRMAFLLTLFDRFRQFGSSPSGWKGFG
jgi:hypothetical protein